MSRSLPITFAILTTFVRTLPAQLTSQPTSASTTQPRYVYRTPTPEGIGKYYMGREIAHVMGHEAADWLDRPEREAEEQPAKLIAALHLRPDQVVADIGAGSGYFTTRLAAAVGSTGRVFAVDIQPEMLDLLDAKLRKLGLHNVDLVLGDVADPKLPPESIDLALLVDVYHEFDHPYEMMQHIVRSLRPGGRVVFVEFRAEDPAVPIKPLHKMSEAQLIREMSPFPLRHKQTITILPRQHIILFEKPRPQTQPTASSPGHQATKSKAEKPQQ